jgi:hypothetical protein
MLLPLIIVEVRTEHLVDYLTTIRDKTYDTEKLIGSHKNYQNLARHIEWGYYERGEAVWARGEFDGAAGVLTSLAADAALSEFQCSLTLKFLSWIDNRHRLAKPETSSDPFLDSWSRLASKISFMKSGLENSQLRCGYLGRRADVAVQQVSYDASDGVRNSHACCEDTAKSRLAVHQHHVSARQYSQPSDLACSSQRQHRYELDCPDHVLVPPCNFRGGESLSKLHRVDSFIT